MIPLLQVPMSATTTAMAVKVLDLCDNGLTTLDLKQQLQTLIAQLAPSAPKGQADEITAALLQAGLFIPPPPSSTPAPPDLSLVTQRIATKA